MRRFFSSAGHQLLARISADPDVVIEFLAVFSRFEFALKKCDYWRELRSQDGEVCGVGVKWRKYASEVSTPFDRAKHGFEVSTAIELKLSGGSEGLRMLCIRSLFDSRAAELER